MHITTFVFCIPTCTQDWQSTWSEHKVHSVTFKVIFLRFPTPSWHEPGGALRDKQAVTHQPHDASVMQAKQVLCVEQSSFELAYGWRNWEVIGCGRVKRILFQLVHHLWLRHWELRRQLRRCVADMGLFGAKIWSQENAWEEKAVLA